MLEAIVPVETPSIPSRLLGSKAPRYEHKRQACSRFWEMSNQPTPIMTTAVLNEQGKDYLPDLLGIEITNSDKGLIESRLDVRPALLAPNGYLHAATVVALADTSCGYGAMTNLPEGATGFTTMELKSNFLGTVREGAITCEARLIHGGRTTQVWDAQIFNARNGQVICLFRCTQMMIYPTKLNGSKPKG
jgi:1,4-dihydroxy-2-naphthoyl-CoA hydrolase